MAQPADGAVAVAVGSAWRWASTTVAVGVAVRVAVGVAVAVAVAVGVAPPTSANENIWAPLLLQVYCCRSTSAVDASGTSRHLALWRAASW